MEPERRIEKLLRAFAKKRREQAGDPMELHPMSRQQLQKEIARRAAGTNRSGWFSSFFVGLRPKLLFAVCFIGLAVLGLMLLPSVEHKPKPATIASANLPHREIAPSEKAVPLMTSPPVSSTVTLAAGERSHAFDDKQPFVSGTGAVVLKPAEQELAEVNRQREIPPTETLKQTQTATFANGIAQTEMPTVTGTTASTAPSNPGSFAFKTEGAAAPGSFGGAAIASAPALSKDAAGEALPATPPMGAFGITTNSTIFAANESMRKQSTAQKQPAVGAPASAAFFDRSKKESDAAIPPLSQLFNRTDVRAARGRPADSLSGTAPVLVSFRVEQAGNALRVIDADGSVYTGVLQLSQPANLPGAASPKNAPATSPMTKTAEPSPAADNYFFRVSGTNRNLHQNVVFSGNLIPLTNLFTSPGGGGGAGGTAPQGAPELRAKSLLLNSRISGKATIGNQEEIEVNAHPGP